MSDRHARGKRGKRGKRKKLELSVGYMTVHEDIRYDGYSEGRGKGLDGRPGEGEKRNGGLFGGLVVDGMYVNVGCGHSTYKWNRMDEYLDE